MIFSELYCAYYNAVAAVIEAALEHPLNDVELRHIIADHAFGESVLNILPALKEERWKLLKSDGTTVLKNIPSMPLTGLQKQWLKAIASDPRIKLFGEVELDFPDVEPLFLPEDYLVFDKYSDGDDYENETYIENFRVILDAIRNWYPISIVHTNRKGNCIKAVIMPEYLEYSEKDDKFRVLGAGNRFYSVLNLGRIISCEPYKETFKVHCAKRNYANPRSVIFELVDQRKALERVLLHFAHFEKQAEKLNGGKYRITVSYDKDDESEMVIRILAFGPMIKVIAPQHFIKLIRERLMSQKKL